MKKIIDKLINHSINGVDTYTHNGSTWLIFTESKQWVIELTESKTLWYNYNFFKGMFDYVSMDVVDNQHYITQWVEDNFINVPKCTEPVEHTRNAMTKDTIKYGVKDTILEKNITEGEVEEIIENGVKDTQLHKGIRPSAVEHTIENGVKETNWFEGPMLSVVDNVIDNGINHTEIGWHQCNNVDDVIEKGVIETKGDASQNPMGKVTKVIKNGVKESIAAGYKDPNSRLVYVKWPDEIDEVLENGVKETKTPSNGDIVSFAEWMKENNSTSYPKLIDDVIENGVKEIRPSGCVDPKTGIFHYRIQEQVDDVVDNGVKEVQPLPDQSGELIGYGNYYHGKEDRTKAFIDYLEETIKFGVKENLG